MTRRTLVVVTVMVALVAVACSGGDDDATSTSTTTTSTTTTTTAPVPVERVGAVPSSGCDGDGVGNDDGGLQTVEHDGRNRRFVVHLPDAYDGSTPVPMTYNLHGFGSTFQNQDESSEMPVRAGERGYLVVSPQGEPLELEFEGQSFWNFILGEVSGIDGSGVHSTAESSELGADDIGFFTELTELLLSQYCVDERRVFSAGMSNGAAMSTVLGCELDGRITAIAPVTGSNFTDVCTGAEPVSVIAFHGDRDEPVPYEGGSVMGIQLGNPSVPDRMAQWAAHNSCATDPAVDDRGDGVVVTRWNCPDPIEVELWTLHGWGHVWPRGDPGTGPASVETTELILDFFDRVGGA